MKVRCCTLPLPAIQALLVELLAVEAPSPGMPGPLGPQRVETIREVFSAISAGETLEILAHQRIQAGALLTCHFTSTLDDLVGDRQCQVHAHIIRAHGIRATCLTARCPSNSGRASHQFSTLLGTGRTETRAVGGDRDVVVSTATWPPRSSGASTTPGATTSPAEAASSGNGLAADGRRFGALRTPRAAAA